MIKSHKAKYKLERKSRPPSCTMITTAKLTEMNEAAVGFVLSDRIGSAISILRRALFLAIEKRTPEAHRKGCSSDHCDVLFGNFPLPDPQPRAEEQNHLEVDTTLLFQQTTIAVADGTPIKTGSCSEHTDSLYNKMLFLPTANIQLDPGHNDSLVVAVLLYNLAYVYHRNGVECGCSLTLRHALSVYDKALSWIALGDLRELYFADKEIVVFAIVSNMNHINGSFFNHEAASECRQFLVDKLPLYSSILSPEDYNFTCLNLLLSRASIAESAPAA